MSTFSKEPPLRRSYPAKVAVMLVALCPNIVVTTGVLLMSQALATSLHGSRLGVELASGLSNAGYALGAVAAVALNQRFDLRPLLLAYQALFVGGSLLCAGAPEMLLFGVGRVVEGLATGLLLVAALPPLVTQFPARRLPSTAALVDVGLFGAVTLGPLLGGLTATGESWRVYFLVLAALGALGFLLATFTVEPRSPLRPGAPLDSPALGLAALGTALPFFAVSELVGLPIYSPIVLAPLLVGLTALVSLIAVEFHRQEPLMPVRLLRTTLPVTGILGAMAAGSVYVAVVELLQTFLLSVRGSPPLAVGLGFWPGLVGIALAALVLRRVFASRHLARLALVGVVVIGLSALLLVLPGSMVVGLEIGVSCFGLGFGAGAAVSPGLFLAALALPAKQVGTVFALVELLRSEAAYLVAPILVYLAGSPMRSGAALGRGVFLGYWISVALTAAAVLAMAALLVAGRRRASAPDLGKWLGSGEEAALPSPLVGERLRGAEHG